VQNASQVNPRFQLKNHSFSVKTWNVISTFLLVTLSYYVSAQHVFFGERNLTETKNGLYLDENGFPYPRYFIPDSAMEKAGGNLENWYRNNPSEFQKIAAIYALPLSNSDSLIYLLNEAIFKDESQRINALHAETITILVHGYRKSFHKITNGLSAGEEFQIVEQNLDSLQLHDAHYIEVYWDGTYDCCYSSNFEKNKQLFQEFEHAYHQAEVVGLALRNVLNQFTCTQLNIVGHSLGARVVTSSLFNLVESQIQTPQLPKIKIALIEPALDGLETFQHYHNRKSFTTELKSDPYELYIIYNPNDFVLRKKDDRIGIMGPGTKKYGKTSLGCDYHHEIKRLLELFHNQYPKSFIKVENLAQVGKKHSWKCYATNTFLQPLVDWLNNSPIQPKEN
jgi:hypothetical protein